MADVITRFKLETTQFDSKLRDAAKGLKEYTHQAELGGKSFTNFSQKSIEAARSLGTIASGANNAKDKVKDLVGAYNEAAKAYNNLSQQQQQSDFGKALAQSIGQLSDRLKEAKKDLYELGNAAENVKNKSGLFGEGGLTGMLQVAGGNLIAKGIATLGSEIAGTVQQSIELARQGEGIRLAFNRLNQPGLLNNLKEATHGTVSELELMKAAIKFDNFKLPLEDLGTYLAFAQQKAQDTGDSVDNMVTSIVNGLGRQSVQILDNLGISASEIRDRMKEGGDMTQVVAQIIREEMTKAGDYVETAATRAARAAAEATDKMEALGREAMPVAEEWASVWNEIKTGGMELLTTVLSPLADSIRSIRELLSQPFEIKFKANIPNLAEGSNIDDNGNYIRRPSNGNWAGYDAANGRYYNEISSIPGISVTGTKPKSGRTVRNGGVSTEITYAADSITAMEKEVSDLTKLWKDCGAAVRDQYAAQLAEAQLRLDTITGKNKKIAFDSEQAAKQVDVARGKNTAQTSGLGNIMSNFDVGTGLSPEAIAAANQWIKNMEEGGNKVRESWKNAASAIGMVGSAMSSVKDPAAQIASTVAMAIANIAMAYSEALAKDETNKSNIWYFIATAGAAVISMATTISQIHASTGYAQGGMIKGNSYSGDNIGGVVDGSQLVGLNAGEIVLNQAQQSNVAHGLQGGAFGGMHLTARLDGKDLLLSIDRTGQTLGYGQLVFFH